MAKLNDREKIYIKKYNSYEKGYNSTKGGEGTRGYKHSDKNKKIISRYSKKQRGENSNNKKTNINEVNEIRKIYINGEQVVNIHKQYNHLAYTTIIDIVKNKTWICKKYAKKMKLILKIDKNVARKIRKDYCKGLVIQQLSNKYNISRGLINNILNNKIYVDKRISYNTINFLVKNTIMKFK